jgi:DNA repair protein SbcC/Rad50
MIIRDLHIHTFGDFQDVRLQFADGCNIVLGENEAGKSTVFNVIDHLLFTPVKLTKREMEKSLNRWFPVGGGDTLSAELSAELGDRAVRYFKCWGGNPEGTIRFSPGGTYSGDDALAAETEKLWGYSPETVRQVCLLRQSTLADTLPSYQNSKEVLQSLTDILQNSLIEGGGISTSGFIETLRDRYSLFFSRWDRDRNYPEKNRGIENPWSVNVGTVLKWWYEMKRAELEVRRVEQLEDSICLLQSSQKEKKKETAALESFLSAFETVYNTAGDRKSLELELREIIGTMERIKKDSQSWGRGRDGLEQALRERKEGNEELGKLRGRIESRDEVTAKRKRFEKYRRLLEVKTKLDALEAKLREQPAIPEKDLQALRESRLAIRESEVKLQSGTLFAQLTAKKNISFSYTPGLGTEKRRDLMAGNSLEITAEGKIRLSHEDWELDVYSGNEDYETVKKELEAGKKEFNALCEKYGVVSVEEGEAQRKVYTDLEGETARARKQFSEERGEDSFEALKKEVESFGALPEETDSTELGREYGSLNERLAALEKTIQEHRERLSYLEETYGTEEKLLDMLADLRGRQRDLEKQVAALPEIPDPFETAEEFLEAYREKQRKRETLRQEIFELDKAAALAVKDLPDISLEELEADAEAARRRFQSALSEGETIGRILETALRIQKEIQENPYTAFMEAAEANLKKMTGQRLQYKSRSGGGDGQAAAPFHGDVRNSRGEILAYGQLSGGTKDAVSLAVRLAMAEYYLKNKAGFLLFDDPLVEMDPRRQKAAAELLSETARRYQSIIFTCHPHMRDLFPNANVIELHRDGERRRVKF